MWTAPDDRTGGENDIKLTVTKICMRYFRVQPNHRFSTHPHPRTWNNEGQEQWMDRGRRHIASQVPQVLLRRNGPFSPRRVPTHSVGGAKDKIGSMEEVHGGDTISILGDISLSDTPAGHPRRIFSEGYVNRFVEKYYY